MSKWIKQLLNHLHWWWVFERHHKCPKIRKFGKVSHKYMKGVIR